MHITAFEPCSLIDYPNHLSAIVFTQGCALRCPFCHNPELLELSAFSEETKSKEVDRFFDFLRSRQGLLEGVSITGGEPTLQPDLIPFMERIKRLGFLVKLDTNGIFPDKVGTIVKTGLVDYWAMDIKHAPDKYHLATGRNVPVERFEQSVKHIMQSGVDYEFRTTVVPGIHQEQDFVGIGQWIAGAKNYYLQTFRDIKTVDPTLSQKSKCQSVNLETVKKILAPHLATVSIRT